jgi:hypothetical protein
MPPAASLGLGTGHVNKWNPVTAASVKSLESLLRSVEPLTADNAP